MPQPGSEIPAQDIPTPRGSGILSLESLAKFQRKARLGRPLAGNAALRSERIDHEGDDSTYEVMRRTSGYFGVLNSFREGNAEDLKAHLDAFPKPTVIEKKTAKEFQSGLAAGGIPVSPVLSRKDPETGKVIFDKENYFKCSVQQRVPLGNLLAKINQGHYKIIDPKTGLEFPDTKELPRAEAIKTYIKNNKCLCLVLANEQKHYEGIVHRLEFTEPDRPELIGGKPSLNRENISKVDQPKWWPSELLGSFEEKATQNFAASFAASKEDAREGNFHPTEIFAMEVELPDGTKVKKPIGGDIDGLVDRMDVTSESYSVLLEIIPDADLPIYASKKETTGKGALGIDEMARELASIDPHHIKKLTEKKELAIKELHGLIEEEKKIHSNVHSEEEKEPLLEKINEKRKKLEERISAIDGLISGFSIITAAYKDPIASKSISNSVAYQGVTTKRELFAQLARNLTLAKGKPQEYFTHQHANEFRHPGTPSDINNKNLVFVPGTRKAVLTRSEQELVDLLKERDQQNYFFDVMRSYLETPAKAKLWGPVVDIQISKGQPVKADVLITYHGLLSSQTPESIKDIFPDITTKQLTDKIEKLEIATISTFAKDLSLLTEILKDPKSPAHIALNVNRISEELDFMVRFVANAKHLNSDHPDMKSALENLNSSLAELEKLDSVCNNDKLRSSIAGIRTSIDTSRTHEVESTRTVRLG